MRRCFASFAASKPSFAASKPSLAVDVGAVRSRRRRGVEVRSIVRRFLNPGTVKKNVRRILVRTNTPWRETRENPSPTC